MVRRDVDKPQSRMNTNIPTWTRPAALLAINLLFLMVWGFTGLSKVISGYPPWFEEVFGKTILATLPGLKPTFYILALFETAAFLLALAALARLEFLERKPMIAFSAMLVVGLFIFIMLGLGKWLTQEYTGTFQLFTYFCGTLLALHYLERGARALPDR
jgi:hypothetical protein